LASNPNITDNRIIGNTARCGGGIYCNDSSPIVITNSLTGNVAQDGGLIHCCGASNPTINYNNLVNDRKYEIYLDEVANAIDARSNWWGTTDTDSIDARIYDCSDDTSLGKVFYTPILTSTAIGEPDTVYLVVLKSDETYTNDLHTNLWIGATMYVQLEGRDGGCVSIDETSVTITSSLTDTIGVRLILIETDTASGIFRGTTLIDSMSIEGTSIGATIGETICAVSQKPGQNRGRKCCGSS